MNNKFKIGDSVGWRSDTKFTASNKRIAPQNVIAVYDSPDGVLYEITNYLGYHLEHELESRH